MPKRDVYGHVQPGHYAEFASSDSLALVANAGAAADKDIPGLDEVPCLGYSHGEWVVTSVADADMARTDLINSSVAGLDEGGNYLGHPVPLHFCGASHSLATPRPADSTRFIVPPGVHKLRCRAWDDGAANTIAAGDFKLRLYSGPVPEKWTQNEWGRSVVGHAGFGGVDFSLGGVAMNGHNLYLECFCHAADGDIALTMIRKFNVAAGHGINDAVESLAAQTIEAAITSTVPEFIQTAASCHAAEIYAVRSGGTISGWNLSGRTLQSTPS